MAQITYYAPAGVTSINLSDGSRAVVVGGQITVDSKFRNELEAAGCSANAETDNAVRFTNTVTGGSVFSAGDSNFSVIARNPILSGASAGQDSGWLPLSSAPERFAYQLDSGSTTTTFSIDISADGVSSLGQAFTGTYASSTVAEITPPIMFSNPLAKFFRWNVVSGGPLSVSRGV